MGNNIFLHVLYNQGHSISFRGNHREPFLASPLRHVSMWGTCICLYSIPLFPFTRFQRLSMLSITTSSPTSSLTLTPPRLALLLPQQDYTCQSHPGLTRPNPKVTSMTSFSSTWKSNWHCLLQLLSWNTFFSWLLGCHSLNIILPLWPFLAALLWRPFPVFQTSKCEQPQSSALFPSQSTRSDLIQAYALNASSMWMALGPTPVQTSPQNSRLVRPPASFAPYRDTRTQQVKTELFIPLPQCSPTQ